jgi:hypothetical protein
VTLLFAKNIYFVALFVKSFLENIKDFSHVNNHGDENEMFLPMSVLTYVYHKKHQKRKILCPKPNLHACLPIFKDSLSRSFSKRNNKASLLLQRERMINI